MEIININDIKIERLLNRSQLAMPEQAETVRGIISAIRERGDEALFEYTEKFDKTDLSQTGVLVSQEEIKQAYENTDAELIRVMRESAENIRDYYTRQKRESFIYRQKAGRELGVLYIPIQSLGIYVPGGAAAYPSSVLMSAIPAAVAGVERIAVATPCDAQLKRPAYASIVAANLAGVSEIYKIGGAQAIAVLAFGTKSVKKVDKIVGPGNIYVALAKREVFGYVGIDSIAGPSEILVIADESADARFVAADILSQAEHDRLSSAWLAVTDASLAETVASEVERQLKLLPREEIARTSIEQNGRILVVDSLETAARLADEIAPEHLELCVDDPFGLLPMVHNAGSVFLGRSCPEPLGDYLAGPNHTLPTSGTARYSSPLGVDDFCRRSSYLYYTPAALEKVSENVMRFARREGLDAHANAVAVRMEGRS